MANPAPTHMDKGKRNPIDTESSRVPESEPADAAELLSPHPPVIPISSLRKWSLLVIFSMSIFFDNGMALALLVFVDPISQDLSIIVEQKSWVLTSYSIGFASTLLLWGRTADVFSAKTVFCAGFVCLGLISLSLSFFVDQYSFLIFRALQGVAGAVIVPAAYRLIVVLFGKGELAKALALYLLSGSLSGCIGNLAGGAMGLIPGSGQKAAWRWFFRIMSALILPIAIGSFFWIPSTPARSSPALNRLRRLDLIGSLSILVGLVLLTLGLTLGAKTGSRSVQFLVPFLLSFPAFAFFFTWEAKIPFEYALLPPSAYHLPNFSTFAIFSLYLYAWMSLSTLAWMQTFIGVNLDSPIVAAARIAPLSIAAAAMCITISVYPRLVARPRVAIIMGILAQITGTVLFIVSDGAKGRDYWKFVFPGTAIGGAGVFATQVATNVGIMSTVPPEMAGVAGAVFPLAVRVGQVVAYSIQAGILTIKPGNFSNWVNVRAQFIFVGAWGLVWLLGFLLCYKPGRKAVKEDEKIDQA